MPALARRQSTSRDWDAERRTALLVTTRLFGQLPADALKSVGLAFRPKQLARGRYVFLAGTSAASLIRSSDRSRLFVLAPRRVIAPQACSEYARLPRGVRSGGPGRPGVEIEPIGAEMTVDELLVRDPATVRAFV